MISLTEDKQKGKNRKRKHVKQNKSNNNKVIEINPNISLIITIIVNSLNLLLSWICIRYKDTKNIKSRDGKKIYLEKNVC